MSFLKSKHNGWTWEMTRTPFMGGGGGGGQAPPTQTNVQNSNIPEYARPYTETMLGTAQQQIYNYDPSGNVTGFKGYTPYGATVDAAGNITNTAQEQANASIAPFSPLQRQAQINAGTMGMPGQFNLGTGFQAMGGANALNAGQNYNMMATNPYAQQAFMSPYMQNAVDVQKNEAFRDAQIRNIGSNLGSARQGTYGGARQVLAEQERNRNLQTQLGQIQATGTQKAFETGQQAQQYGANLGLQGYGQAVGAGTALGQMGSQQLAAQRGIIDVQSQLGGQQQGMEQQKINQAIQNYAMQQQYPMQQLSAMSGLLRGLPLQSATTQSYQAAPSTVSQISGLGLAGAAAYGLARGAAGGEVKSYADGGAIEDDTENFVSGGISQAITNRVRMNPDGYSKQAIDKSTKNGLVDDIVGLAAIQEKNKNEKERQAQIAMAQGTPPTIKDQILAERDALEQQRGIEMAQSNLPTEYAGGGIVAFDDGGEVEHFEEGGVTQAIKDYYNRMTSKLGGASESVATFPGIPTTIGGISLFGAASKDADAQPGGLYGTGTNQPAVAAAPAKPGTGIRILDNAPAVGTKPSSLLEKTTGGPEMKTDTSGIDEILKQSISDIKGLGKENANARKEAKLMGMLQAGLGIMGGTSPFAAANFKGAIPGIQSYQEEMRGIRSDESKQIAQLAALNLKGAELKQELNKLGVTKEYYDSQIRKNDAYAKYLAGGKGAGGANYGPVNNETYLKLKDKYTGLAANPKADPAFFSSLPKDVQNALGTKVGSPSYVRGLEAAKGIASSQFSNDINQMRILAARKGPNASSTIDADL
jgi:hypothetical protein